MCSPDNPLFTVTLSKKSRWTPLKLNKIYHFDSPDAILLATNQIDTHVAIQRRKMVYLIHYTIKKNATMLNSVKTFLVYKLHVILVSHGLYYYLKAHNLQYYVRLSSNVTNFFQIFEVAIIIWFNLHRAKKILFFNKTLFLKRKTGNYF